MRTRITAVLAAAAAATLIVLLAGCGGSASEASPPAATSTAPIRQAAGEDGLAYAAAITSLPIGRAYHRAVYEVANDYCTRIGTSGACQLANQLRCSVTAANPREDCRGERRDRT
jgi:hypothetical protein